MTTFILPSKEERRANDYVARNFLAHSRRFGQPLSPVKTASSIQSFAVDPAWDRCDRLALNDHIVYLREDGE